MNKEKLYLGIRDFKTLSPLVSILPVQRWKQRGFDDDWKFYEFAPGQVLTEVKMQIIVSNL